MLTTDHRLAVVTLLDITIRLFTTCGSLLPSVQRLSDVTLHTLRNGRLPCDSG